MAKILSISYDESLLLTRKMLLEQMGHTVYSAEGFAKAYELCGHHDSDFDLVILGHSIPHDDKVAIFKHCKDACTYPVLALLRRAENPVPGAERSIDSSDPQAFMAAVNEIVGNKTSPSGGRPKTARKRP